MNTRFMKKRATLLNSAVIISLSLSSILVMPVSADDNIIAEDCFLYGVHDAGLNDSQLIGIKGTHSYAIGDLYAGYDIEGLDINPDGQLYGSSGDDADEGHPAGHLYKIDPSKTDSPDQFITSIGNIEIHFSNYADAPVDMVKDKEVSALSFRPDGTLWGWVEECGLVEIDKNTGRAELHYLAPSYDICVYADPSSYTSHIEDISWNNTGDIIYAVEQNRIWAYRFDTGAISLASQLELNHNVEAIEVLPDNTLLIGLNGSTLLGNLNLETDELVTTKLKSNIFYDIEALAWSCPTGFDGQLPDVTEPEICGTDWHYAIDPINDSSGDSPETRSNLVGNSYYEVYGAAIKLEDETVTIAVNTRLPMGGDGRYSTVAWSDLFIDFGGKLYGVRFDNKNDTAYPVGLYEVSQTASLTKSNYGYSNFIEYESHIRNDGGSPSLGDLPILDNGYFRNGDPMPTTIKTGVKVADIQLLDSGALAAKGLDFATNLGLAPSRYTPATPYSSTNKKPANELGEYTFGFSFPRQADMTDAFIAYVFTECGNDGVAMASSLPSCEVTPPVVEEPTPPVEEPTPPVVEEPAPPVEEPTPPVVEEPADDCAASDTTATTGDTNDNVTVTVVDSEKVDYTSVFDIALVEHTGNTWTYKVDYVKGHALSHWDLLIPSCIGHFTDYTSGAEIGKDGSIKDRDATGIKWNTSGGTFSFTLDANYPAIATEVLAKTATDYATDMITAPNCDATPVVSTPTTCGSSTDESIDDSAPVVEEPTPPAEEPAPPVVEEPVVEVPTPATEITGEQVVVALNDNKDSKYGFTLVSHVGNTWTYEVEELKGRSLSHWGLGLGLCLNKIASSTPSGAEIGIDGSTGFNSIKWNTSDSFTKGQFSFTLNGNYPAADVQVLAKAGTKSNTASIVGPKCD